VTTTEPAASQTEQPDKGSPLEVLLVATKLGLTSFGGPIAHLGYFHNEYVERRKWLSDEAYAEVVAISQALPGPASSQTGIAVGLLRAGYLGGLMAWIGFTLPSAIALTAFGFGVRQIGNVQDEDWLHGLMLAAVAIVALAVWNMARTLAPDKERATMAILAAIVMLSWETAFAQVVVIIAAGLVGWRLFHNLSTPSDSNIKAPVSRNVALGCIATFFVLLVAFPLLSELTDSQGLRLFGAFYRSGALVFGGGHVVLPLLDHAVVTPGWVSRDDFLAGYGAAQAVPGPLFTFSAFLGAISKPEPSGIAGATIALTAIFLPSFFLIFGGLPLWSAWRHHPGFQAALRGINAAVVGLLLAALYQPVWTSAVREASDFAIVLSTFGLLALWKLPPWTVVVFAAVAAEVVGAL
jgi:chromate transporter